MVGPWNTAARCMRLAGTPSWRKVLIRPAIACRAGLTSPAEAAMPFTSNTIL